MIGFFVSNPWIPIPIAIAVGLLAAMVVFTRRAQRSMYAQAEGQPGAAGWMLQQQLRGDWRLTQAVAGTTQLDAVHRLIGRPGIVLVGEGAPHRVRGLLAQEKKRVARIAGDTPIYDVTVGPAEGDVPIGKLNRHLMKLPRNLSKEQITAVEKRLAALGGSRQQLPQGPLPPGRQDAQRTTHGPPPVVTGPAASVSAPQAYRGQRLGLPESGPGSLSTTGVRLGAFVVDALASSLIAALFVRGTGVTGHLPGSWSLIPLAVDYLGGLLLGGRTLGMYLFGLRVIRVDQPVAIGPVPGRFCAPCCCSSWCRPSSGTATDAACTTGSPTPRWSVPEAGLWIGAQPSPSSAPET